MKTQLLCTFCSKYDFEETVDLIKLAANVVFNKIYIFENIDEVDSLICTYNVDSINTSGILSKTISWHRKKQSNPMYTINALNELIKSKKQSIVIK